jgi:hypothetical protein
VTDVSDALDSIASLKVRNEKIIPIWVSFLSNRVAEIKYSPICGLWQSITDSLGHLRYFDGKWMRFVEDMGSNLFGLKLFASFQLIFFTSSLGRLNFFSPKIYAAIATTLANDVNSINDIDMLSTLLFPFERANFTACEALRDAVIDRCNTLISKNKNPNRNTIRGAIGVSFIGLSLGAHKSAIQPMMERIFEVLGNKSTTTRDFLIPQDFQRLFRIAQLTGVPPPSTVTSHPAYSWHGPSAKSRIKWVENVAKEFAQIRHIYPSKDLPLGADIELSDGTYVVVDDFSDPMMTWRNPDDERSYDLVKLESSGNAELTKRILSKKSIVRYPYQ